MPTPNIHSGKLVDTSRRMVDETRLLIDRLRPPEATDKILYAIGRAQRQLRRSQLSLLRIERVLNTNPGLFGVRDHVDRKPTSDVAYRRFMEGLRVASPDTLDDRR